MRGRGKEGKRGTTEPRLGNAMSGQARLERLEVLFGEWINVASGRLSITKENGYRTDRD